MTKVYYNASLIGLAITGVLATQNVYSQAQQDYASTTTPDSSQERKIETITVLGQSNTEGATLGGVDLKSLPINTHVVGKVEMERLRFVDPDEFLDRIPGETQVRNLRIPDGGKGYTIPMLDGVPMESPYEGATQRLDRTNTFDIERVEVIKGPASALYPNNAFGGVVNVVTRDAPLESETRISLEGGDFDRLRIGLSTGGTLGKFGYFFDANSRSLQGLRDDYVNDRDQVSTKLIYHDTDYTTIAARAEFIEENRVDRGDLTAEQIAQDKTQAGGLSSSTDLEQSTLSVKMAHMLESGQLELDVVRREKDTVGASRFRGPQDENDLGISSKVTYRHDFDGSSVIGGFDRYDGKQDTRQYERNDLELTGPFVAFENNLEINAYFAQYQVEATNQLTLTLGARYEDIHLDSTLYDQQADFSDIAPKLGATYQLDADNLLWVGLSEGFYAPDATDLFDLDEGNPDLKPEEAQNLEVGLRGSSGAWQYDTSIYLNEITNYLVTQEFVDANGDEFERTTNAGQVTLKGIESVLEYAPDDSNWRVGLTHTFARNKYDAFVQSTAGADDDLSGKVLRRSPNHHFNLRFAWLPTERVTVELEGDYYSHYFADNANSPESRFTRGERINLRVDYQIDQWRFWLHGLNLTDTLEDRATYSRGTMAFRTVDGRTFYAGLSYQI